MNYLILPSCSIGGSEVRLVNNWIYSHQQAIGEVVTLVVTPQLLNSLEKRPEIFADLKALQSKIKTIDFPGSFYLLQRHLSRLIETELRDAKSIAILLNMPLQLKEKKRLNLIYIHPGTSVFSHSNFKGVVGQLACVLKADRIDVLDPGVFNMLRRVFFFKRSSFTLTKFGINQNSLHLTERINYAAKENNLVFVGRFVALKQISEFLDCVEYIHQSLKQASITRFKFVVIGHGALEDIVKEKVAALQRKDIKIVQYSSNNPYNCLLNSKIFFSLQRHNNYPSQSLIEAMLCGCLPIVTDCGDTKLIADPSFSFYVPEKFNKEQLAKQCKRILLLSDKAFEERSKKSIIFLKANFGPTVMAKYYSGLFGKN